MDWIIDGYNVLIGNDLGSDETARREFRRRIEARFWGKRVTVTIVYDSRGSTSVQRRKVSEGVTEVFVENADSYIVDKIRRSRQPRSIILVTDDRVDIVSKVRSLGVGLINPAEFLTILSPPRPRRRSEKPERESPENIKRYLRLFGGK